MEGLSCCVEPLQQTALQRILATGPTDGTRPMTARTLLAGVHEGTG